MHANLLANNNTRSPSRPRLAGLIYGEKCSRGPRRQTNGISFEMRAPLIPRAEQRSCSRPPSQRPMLIWPLAQGSSAILAPSANMNMDSGFGCRCSAAILTRGDMFNWQVGARIARCRRRRFHPSPRYLRGRPDYGGSRARSRPETHHSAALPSRVIAI